MTGRKNATKSLLFGYRNWNILAFRGRLMSLLAPARGMPTLSAKDGFSRTSSIRSAGSHRGLWDCDYSPHRKHFLPQDKDTYGSGTSHAEKANVFFKEPRIFQLLGWFFIHKGCSTILIHPSQFHSTLTYSSSEIQDVPAF